MAIKPGFWVEGSISTGFKGGFFEHEVEARNYDRQVRKVEKLAAMLQEHDVYFKDMDEEETAKYIFEYWDEIKNLMES